MELFKKLNGLLSNSGEGTRQKDQQIDRKSLSPEQIDDVQKVPASEQYRSRVYRMFYASYANKPFISLDREINTDWIEQAKMFPQSIVLPEMMIPYEDGLLPGHIYLLYWLGKGNHKKVPSYFEYKYGIEFEKEKQFLIDAGYLENEKPTLKGADAIVAHYDVIEAHSPKSKSAKESEEKFADSELISIEQDTKHSSFIVNETHLINGKNLMIVSDNDKERVVEDLTLINELLYSIRKELRIKKELQIPAQDIIYNSDFSQELYSYLEYEPLTKTGKQSKYPFQLHFATQGLHDMSLDFSCFGSISYLKDNRMGKGAVHLWYQHRGYHIYLTMINDKLSVQKVDRNTEKDPNTITIYKTKR